MFLIPRNVAVLKTVSRPPVVGVFVFASKRRSTWAGAYKKASVAS